MKFKIVLLLLVIFFASTTYAQNTLEVEDSSDLGEIFELDSMAFHVRYINGSTSLNDTNVSCDISLPDGNYSMVYENSSTALSLYFSSTGGFYYQTTTQNISWTSYAVNCSNLTASLPVLNATANMTIYNAKLTIWDEESSNASRYFTTNQSISFYANFTNVSNASLAGVNFDCNISIETLNEQQMSYDSPTGLYNLNVTFSQYGVFDYNVSCVDYNGAYSNRTKNGTLKILEDRPFFIEKFVGATEASYFAQSLDGLLEYYEGKVLFAEINTSNSFMELLTIGSANTNKHFSIFNINETNITNSNFQREGHFDLKDALLLLFDPDKIGNSAILASGKNTTNKVQGQYFGGTILNNGSIQSLKTSGLSGPSGGYSTLQNFPQTYNLIVNTGTTNSNGAYGEVILYENNSFNNISTYNNISSLSMSSHALAYLNNDSMIDLLIMGSIGIASDVIYVYLNNGTQFVLHQQINNITQGRIGCADFENNGKVDCIVNGLNDTASVTYYLSNDGLGNLTINTLYNFDGLNSGDMQIIDIDNNGYIDIVYNGQNNIATGNLTIYTFNGTSFSKKEWLSIKSLGGANFPQSLSVSDYDYDGDVDIAYAGFTQSGAYTAVWQSNYSLINPNQKPNPPTNISTYYQGGRLYINWTDGTDDKTPSSGLYYNIRVGTSLYGNEIVTGVQSLSPTDPSSFFGNMKNRRNVELAISESNYFIQVQSIDGQLRTSDWSNVSYYTLGSCDQTNTGYYIDQSCIASSTTIQLGRNANITINNITAFWDLNDVTIIFNSTGNYQSRFTIDNGTVDMDNVTIYDRDGYIVDFIVHDNLTGIDVTLNNTRVQIFGNVTLKQMHHVDQTSKFYFFSNATVNESSFERLVARANITLINSTYQSLEMDQNSLASIYSYFSVFTTPVSSIFFNGSYAQYGISNANGKAIFYDHQMTLTNASGTLSPTSMRNYTVFITKYQYYPANATFNQTLTTNVTVNTTQSGEPNWTNFMNAYTTNLTILAWSNNLTNVSGILIGNQFGVINYNESITLANIDINNNIIISNNTIYINGSESNLDKEATLIIKNITYTYTPLVRVDGSQCTSCTNIIYNASTNETSFYITETGNYTTAENSNLVVEHSSGEKLTDTKQINFTVYYNNATNSTLINSANCTINFSDSVSANLTFNGSYYRYNRTFSIGTYNYTVQCNAVGYEQLLYTSSLSIAGDYGFFYESGQDILDLRYSTVFEWDDYIIITGENSTDEYAVKINKTDMSSTLLSEFTAFSYGYAVVFDYDKDGDQDIIAPGTSTLKLYKNNGDHTFTSSIITGTTAYSHGGIAVLDYNNDYWPDIVIVAGDGSVSGCTSESAIILTNQNGTFSVDTSTLSKLCLASIVAIDYNDDGWNDLVMTGINTSDNPETIVYENNEGTFEKITHGLPNVYSGMLGVLRMNETTNAIIIAGKNISAIVSQIFIVDSNFIVFSQELEAAHEGIITIADYTDSGYDGFYFSGQLTEYEINQVGNFYYKNNKNYSKDFNQTSIEFIKGNAIFFDYQNDSDLDFLYSGLDVINTQLRPKSSLYISDFSLYSSNTPPSTSNINLDATTGYLNWSEATDDDSYITYNVRLGNATNKHAYITGIPYTTANPTTSFTGNMQNKLNTTYNTNNRTCYYYAVQVYDRSLETSSWTEHNYSTTEICDNIDNDCRGQCSNDKSICTQDTDCGAGTCLFIDQTYDNDADGIVDSTYIAQCSGVTVFDYCPDNANKYQQGTCGSSNSVSTSSSSSSGGGGGAPPLTNTPKEDTIQENQDKEQPTEQETIPTQDNSRDNEESVTQILTELQNKPYRFERTITTIGQRTKVMETLTNINTYPLEAIKVTLNIPKEIEESASNIIPTTKFTIIEEDPIIQFDLGTIPPLESKTYSYTIKNTFSILNVTPQIEYKNISTEQIEEQIQKDQNDLNKTEGVLKTNTKVESKDNQTVLTVNFDFEDNETVLYNVTVFQYIPECLLEIINTEIAESNRHFTILKEDPLVAWHFDHLSKTDEIQLKINAVADEDCTNLVETRTLARNIISIKKVEEGDLIIWPPILVITILFIFLFIISTYTQEKHHKDEEVKNIIRKAKRLLRLHWSLERIQNHLEHDYSKEKIDEAINAIKHPIRQFFIKMAIGFEFIILILLIALNIMDFFKIISGDVDFIKKMVSWILLIVVFNHVGISRVLFGKEKRWIDATLLLSFFLLTLKNFIGFVDKSLGETSWVRDLYIFIKYYNLEFQTITFLIGIAGILIVTFYVTIQKHVHKESFFGALFLHHRRKEYSVIMFFQVLFVLLLFFVLVFNLMFEWLAIAVDAPILVTVLIITLVTLIIYKITHHYKTKQESLVEKVAEAPDHFYENLIELFHHPKFLPLGIAGMFVLHLVTEIGIYVIPYTLGIIDPVYVNVKDTLHTPLFSITDVASQFSISASGFTWNVQSLFAAGYAFNLIALALALIIPIWLWLYMYKHKNKPISAYSILHVFKFHDNKVIEIIGKILIIVFPLSLLMALTKQAFNLVPLRKGLLLGVDILTRQITIEWIGLILLVMLLLLPVFIFAVKKHIIITTTLALGISMIGVAIYDFLYLESMNVYFGNIVRSMVPWSGLWSIAENITIIATLILVLISIASIYIIAASLLLFMYLPTKFKHVVHDKIFPKHIAEAQKHHHIHFHHIHDHHIHGSKLQVIKEHIEAQLNAGHELFIIVEHLHHKGWEWDIIEQAVKELDGTQTFESDLKHVKHFHHNKDELKKLIDWIHKHYKKAIDLELIINSAQEAGWTEDDIGAALKQMRLHKEDKEIKIFLENINL